MTRHRRIAATGAVSCVVLLAGGGVALATSSGSVARSGPSPLAARHMPLSRHFAVLGKNNPGSRSLLRAATGPRSGHFSAGATESGSAAATPLAEFLAMMPRYPGPQAVEAQPSDAAIVPVESTNFAAVTPGAAGACLTAQVPSAALTGHVTSRIVSTCAPTASIEAEGLQLTVGARNGETYAWGMVPNGNSTVTLSEQGTTVTVPVVDNVYYSGPVETRISSVSFRGISGAMTKVPLS